MNQNPEIARLEAESKLFGESEVRLLQIMEGRSYKAENKAMAEIAKAGSNGTRIAVTLDPALDTEEKQATWFNNKIKQDPDLGILAANMNSDEGMLDAVIYTKSGAVPDVVASLHAQAKAPNNPALQETERVKSLNELNQLKKDVNNPVKRDEILASIIPNKEMREAKVVEMKMKTMNMPPKDAAAAENSFYRDMALISLSVKRQADMVGNVTSWDAASLDKLQKSPTLAPALTAMSNTGLLLL